MPTRSELETALRNAHAAGDTQAAQALAGALQSYSEPSEERGTIADSLGQGALLGFSDEIAGALGAVPASFTVNDGIMNALKGIPDAYRGIRDQARINADAFAERNPGTALASEIAGGLLTGGVGAGRALTGTAGREMVKQSAKVGAGFGGVSGLGYSDADNLGDAAIDTAAGTVAGGLMGAAFPAAGQGLAKIKAAAQRRYTPSANYESAVNQLKKEGVELTGGQVQGSNWQKIVEEQLGDTPIVGTPLQRVQEGQRAQFQKGLLRKLGVDEGDGLIDFNKANDVLDELSAEYGKALKGKKIDLADDEFLNDLGRIASDNTQLVDAGTETKVEQIISKFLDKAISEGKQTGDWYQAQRSIFARKSKGQTELAGMYGDLKNALDDAFERANPAAKGDIDKRWAQAKQLQRIASQGGAEVSEGLLPLASLNSLAKRSPGGKEWRDYINAGAAILPARVGNSGTASRQAAQRFIDNPLGGLGSPGGLALLGGAVTNLPATIVGGVGLNRLAARQAAGKALDVTALLPSGGLLNRPQAAGTGALAGLLTQQ